MKKSSFEEPEEAENKNPDIDDEQVIKSDEEIPEKPSKSTNYRILRTILHR